MEGHGNQKPTKKTPQELIAAFWGRFHSKRPGKVTSIFPRSLYSNVLPSVHPRGAHSARNAAESYEAAASYCRQMVARIVRECRRTNEKYTDPDFDIERDPEANCLNGLVRDGGDGPPLPSSEDVKDCLYTLVKSQILDNGSVRVNLNALEHFINSDDNAGGRAEAGGGMFSNREEYHPGSVHRIDWIFDSPQFTVNGYSSSDIKQGANGDCWWLAAVATIAHRKDLMEHVCVARDEECGVYGFVFQRDGEWVSVIVDDNLYLTRNDFDAYGDMYDSTGRKSRLHRKRYQTGSEALYFARCEDPNETWLPLLEKAYAKTHGDYEAISGGWPGEAVEDMTGGVASTVTSNRVLSKDKLWRELCNNDGEFVFALAAMGTGWDWQKSGLALGHAYSILQCRQETDEHGKVIRLVQIRNPWGERHWSGVGEWNGPWSDGAKEWTPYWLKKLNYTFGDDGVFWMSYKDMLETFMFIHRTRLFDARWTVVQQWTSANVSWITGYLQTKFEITVAKGGLVVIVLTQLDERYFRGFQAEYYFELHFLLQEVGAASGEHLCRVRPVHRWENRSVSCEVELEAGKRYEVLPKITATRNGKAKPPQEVVQAYAEKNPQKLRQVGMSYDLAHAKGGVPDEDDILEKKRAEQRKKKEDAKEKHRHERKKQKAIAKAAEAMKEVAKEEEEAEKEKKEEEGEATADTSSAAKDTKEADEDKETWVDANSALESQKLDTPNGSEPKNTNEVSNAPSPTAESGEKEEEKADMHEEDSKKEEKGKEEEAGNQEYEEEGQDDDSSDQESSDEEEDDEDGGEGPAMPPWNAVAVIGLRVYALDPEVTVELVKATGEDEVTTLTVDGKPAGATM